MMAKARGKHYGGLVDEFRIAQAAHSVMDALALLPPRDQMQEWPKLKEAVDCLDNALIDLQHCGVEICPRPTQGGENGSEV